MIPEEKDLDITERDVAWDMNFIKRYEAKIKDFEAKAARSIGPKRGAYKAHITMAKKSLDAVSGNLAYHLDWLKRFRPEIYEKVK